MNILKKITGNGFSYWCLLFLKKLLHFQIQTLYSKNTEALLYTLGKCYGTLRYNLQRSE